jgi:CRP/FNR family transcriptional regulator, cyclic AMP receptor protein
MAGAEMGEAEEVDSMRMSIEEEVQLLRTVDILEPLSDEELDALARRCPDDHLQAGEIFYTPYDTSEKLFILKRGRVRIYTTTDGREFTQTIVEAGTVFGEMALTAQQLQGAYAQAMEPAILITMSREELEHLILQKPEVGLHLAHLLSERLRRQETRLEDANTKDVHARLAGIIVLLVESEGVKTNAGYRIPAHHTHERLGTMIGANRVAVTRAFGLLQDEGVVELRRRLIHVTDIEALRRTAAYGDAQEEG